MLLNVKVTPLNVYLSSYDSPNNSKASKFKNIYILSNFLLILKKGNITLTVLCKNFPDSKESNLALDSRLRPQEQIFTSRNNV